MGFIDWSMYDHLKYKCAFEFEASKNLNKTKIIVLTSWFHVNIFTFLLKIVTSIGKWNNKQILKE